MTADDSRSDAATVAAGEPVEVLDSDGTITDVVARSRMRAERLAHRATYVVTVIAEPPPFTCDTSAAELDEWIERLTWPMIGPGHGATPAMVPPPLCPPFAVECDTPVVVHKRADWKDVYPGYWDLAFGGVCSPGESWLASAERELTEEAGLPTITMPAAGSGTDREPPTVVLPIGAGHYVADESDTFGAIFIAFAPRCPRPVDDEVVTIETVPVGDLTSWVDDRRVCPDSLAMVPPSLAMLKRNV